MSRTQRSFEWVGTPRKRTHYSVFDIAKCQHKRRTLDTQDKLDAGTWGIQTHPVPRLWPPMLELPMENALELKALVLSRALETLELPLPFSLSHAGSSPASPLFFLQSNPSLSDSPSSPQVKLFTHTLFFRSLTHSLALICVRNQLQPFGGAHRSAGLTEWFELFVCGRELANTLLELTDPVDQKCLYLGVHRRLFD
ncbi:Lysine--tRNA ligase [Nymphaea thermarum]|nr:Lysine--tRNA ligase [Nymphaea thermarum]